MREALGRSAVDYDSDLALLKACFIGGGEGAFYFRMLERLRHREHIDWLDVGIGRDGSSLLPFVTRCRNRGQSVAITGVDPDAEAGAFERHGARWRLIRGPFQTWRPDMTFDIVNADQSVYYLENLDGLLAALKPGGLLLATCWSRDDTLHQLRGQLFPEAGRGLVGEVLLVQLHASPMLDCVEATNFSTEVDLGAIAKDRQRLQAAVRVISRGSGITDIHATTLRLAVLLSNYPPVAPRVNMAICFQRRADQVAQFIFPDSAPRSSGLRRVP